MSGGNDEISAWSCLRSDGYAVLLLRVRDERWQRGEHSSHTTLRTKRPYQSLGELRQDNRPKKKGLGTHIRSYTTEETKRLSSPI